MGRIHGLALRRSLAACAASAVGLLPALATAAPDPSPTVSELVVTASKTVDELVVTAGKACLKPSRSGGDWAKRPKVVSTFPAAGTVVRPGILVLRVTFDQPMACAGMLEEDLPFNAPCPGVTHQLLLSLDRMTVRTACVVEPGKRYGAFVDKDTADDSPFVSLTGGRAHQYELRFSTSAAAPVATVCEALSEDEQTAHEIRARRKLDCAAPPAAAGG
jgi:hypothetical protein